MNKEDFKSFALTQLTTETYYPDRKNVTTYGTAIDNYKITIDFDNDANEIICSIINTDEGTIMHGSAKASTILELVKIIIDRIVELQDQIDNRKDLDDLIS